MVTWQEASNICEPIFHLVYENNFDVEQSMPAIRKFLVNWKIKNSLARDCLYTYVRMIAEDERKFEDFAHGEPSIHDNAIRDARRKLELLLRVKSLLPKED